MKDLSILKTQSNNHYLVCSSSKFYILSSPLLLFFIENKNEVDYEKNPLPKHLKIGGNEYKTEEIEYYFKKYLFLKDSGLIAERVKPSSEKLSGLIHKDSLKLQLANLSQLVFEVTDSCNLKCKYCGYGELYNEYEERNNRFMTFEIAKTIIDYLVNLWNSNLNHSMKKSIRLGFYGGEPLLNINLIKKIVEYISSIQLPSIRFTFGMTTNGMLLDKYMDYLVEKDFHILVSLDGNKFNQSYRVLHDGSNSFDKVYGNLKLLRKFYPDFFNSNILFNSVLHNRNSVAQIHTFIKNEFGKNSRISEVNSMGIDQVKWKEFLNIYKNAKKDLEESKNDEQFSSEIGLNNVDFSRAIRYIHRNCGNIFRRYSDLFKIERNRFIPTGTCFPFERKMFVTVTGKILPCERISQKYYFGEISDNKVRLDFGNIALKTNNYLKKVKKQCINCYFYSSCPRCMYRLNDLEGDPVCNDFMNKNQYDEYSSEILSYIENHPDSYNRSYDIYFE